MSACIKCSAPIGETAPRVPSTIGNTCIPCWTNTTTDTRTESVEQLVNRVTAENAHLRWQRDELQAAGTRWVEFCRRRPPLKVVRVDKTLPLPEYKSSGAAGLDMHASIKDGSLVVDVGFVIVRTGVALEIEPGYFGDLRPRSGCTKDGLEAMVGTIDADYRGVVSVLLKVHRGQTIKHGDRIAQLVVLPVARCEIQEVEELSKTERGDQGWGSSGR